MTLLPPKKIRTDGGTQPRAELDHDKIQEYAQAMYDGDIFPAITVFHDGKHYWLADGFHRKAAHHIARPSAPIEADIKQGTQRDAILHSAGANATHGLPRSSEDKRRAVRRLLTDDEWTQWSNREIARRCKVSDPFVGKIRAELVEEGILTANVSSEKRTYTTKHGTPATMKTAKIGRKPDPLKTRLQRAEASEGQKPVNMEELKTAVMEWIDALEVRRKTFVETENNAHTNSMFWKQITRYLDLNAIPYGESTLKYTIKQLHAQATVAEPVEALPEPVEADPITIPVTGDKFDQLRKISSAGDLRGNQIKGIFHHGRLTFACTGIGYFNGRDVAYARRIVLQSEHDGPTLTHEQTSRAAIQDSRRSIYDYLAAEWDGRQYVLLPGEINFFLTKDPPPDPAEGYATINRLEHLIHQWLIYIFGNRDRQEHYKRMYEIKTMGKGGEEFNNLSNWITEKRVNFRKNDLWQAANNMTEQLRQQLLEKAQAQPTADGPLASPAPAEEGDLPTPSPAQTEGDPRIETIRNIRTQIEKLMIDAKDIDKGGNDSQLFFALNRVCTALDAALATLKQ